jgi:hypothetical protein
MKLQKTAQWDEAFFSDWVTLQRRLYASDKKVIQETLDDFQVLLKEQKTFPDDRWMALSLSDESGLRARALVAVSNNRPELAKVGFIECDNDEAIFRELWGHVEAAARELGANRIKGPINLHFFVSYRWKTWGKAKPFYGEPQQKAYYLKFFEMVGMKQAKTWDTFRIRFWRSKRQYGEIREAKKPEHRLHIRGVDMSRFDEEMAIIHRLFIDTFKEMPEFEPIPFESFKQIYAGFRHIISPFFAFIIEHEQKPVAFCVNFMDPHSIITQYHRLNRWLPSLMAKLWLLLRIKMNFSRLLIMYVGRMPAPHGQEFKGIQSLVAKKMFWPVALSQPQLLICYTAEDSPALKSYAEDQKEMLSSYAVFEKALD